MKYKYKSPEKSGYKRVRVSLKRMYNNGLAYRGNTLFKKARLYVGDSGGVIEYRNTLLAKALVVVFAPIILLINGFNAETLKEIDSQLREDVYGSFSSDTCSLQCVENLLGREWQQ